MDTQKPVVIMTDSTCDLPRELIVQYHLQVIPLYVVMGDNSYQDGVEMDTARLLAWSDANKTVPKTACISQADFIAAFRPYVEAGKSIVYIGLSSELSATLQNARLAAQEFPEGEIAVVDSRNLSSGLGLLAMEASEAAQRGLSAKEVADYVECLVPRLRVSFVISTLTNLYRGGRCTAVQLLGSNVLHINPEIIVTNGGMTTRRKYRGSLAKSLRQYCKDQLKDVEQMESKRILVTYSPMDDAIYKECTQMVRDTGHFETVLNAQSGCVISSHCGAGSLGLIYLVKEGATI